jgi:hypothetical protein
MADYTRPAFTGSIAKPELRRRVKGRAKRQEKKVVDRVRAQCVARDGDCRIGHATSLFGACSGESEWAHLEGSRRFETRGQDPEDRHTTAGSLMACTAHHQMYDRHELAIEPLMPEGADSTLRFVWNGISVLSVPKSGERTL